MAARFSFRLWLSVAGGMMVVLLLSALALTAVTGINLLAIEGTGPFANSILAGFSEDIIEDLHEFFANVTLTLIFFHVVGILLANKQHGENLIKSMITGKKDA